MKGFNSISSAMSRIKTSSGDLHNGIEAQNSHTL